MHFASLCVLHFFEHLKINIIEKNKKYYLLLLSNSVGISQIRSDREQKNYHRTKDGTKKG